MAEIIVDVKDETCPVPLVEVRKALNKASTGDLIVVTGTHSASKKEIPMAAKDMGYEIVEIQENDGIWTIKIRK